MFLSHFRLNAEPFAVALDPAFFYPGPDHREALAALYYVVTQRRGCGMILAETGMGKTMVLHYLRKLIGAGAATIFINGPANGDELLDALAAGLGVEEIEGRHQRLRAMEELLALKSAQRRHVILGIDDAHRLTVEAFDLLQTVCGFENAGGKMIDVLLAGRPSLMRTLAAPGLERLRQSIDASCGISPFDEAGTAEYLCHRLTRAGATHNLFTDEASGLITAVTRGVPRRINQLGHHTLARAWARGSDCVDEEVVWEVLYEMPVPELLAVAPSFAGKELGDGRV